MLEVRSVRTTAPEDLCMKATYARPEGGEWMLFLEVLETGWWIIVDGFEPYPTVIDISAGGAEWWGKLAIYIGVTWAEICDDWEDVVDMQRNALDHMGPRIRGKLGRSTLQDVMEWREAIEAQPVQSGELLRQQILNIEPLAGRN